MSMIITWQYIVLTPDTLQVPWCTTALSWPLSTSSLLSYQHIHQRVMMVRSSTRSRPPNKMLFSGSVGLGCHVRLFVKTLNSIWQIQLQHQGQCCHRHGPEPTHTSDGADWAPVYISQPRAGDKALTSPISCSVCDPHTGIFGCCGDVFFLHIRVSFIWKICTY